MQYTELKRTLRTRVQERMEYAKDISDEEVENAIDEVLVGEEFLKTYPVNVRKRLRKELFDSLSGWIFCRFLWRIIPSRKS